MNILILGVGKTKHDFVVIGIEKYLKQLKSFCKLDFLFIKDEANKDNCINLESERLIQKLPAGFYSILLDVEGKEMSSEVFAKKIENLQNASVKGIVFVIGGHKGVNDALRQKVDLRLSFSRFTLTHQMIRLFLVEQIYRAYSIIKNTKYHK